MPHNLIPPSRSKCQSEIPNPDWIVYRMGETIPRHIRCNLPPVAIIQWTNFSGRTLEIRDSKEERLAGAMSLCERCLKVAMESYFDEDEVEIIEKL